MTEFAWLRAHPANRFAAECLTRLKAPTDPRAMPLLSLAAEWLRRAPAGALPWPEFQAELKERAHLLLADDPLWATSLLVEDLEQLEEDVEHLPPGQAREKVLSEHLDRLLPALTSQPTVGSVGQVLAENLYHSLRHSFPAFGHPSG